MTERHGTGRRDMDAALPRMVKRSSKWFIGMVAANLLSILLLAFHVGMWRHQAEAQQSQIGSLTAMVGSLQTQVGAQAREISRLAGIIEGRGVNVGPHAASVAMAPAAPVLAVKEGIGRTQP